MINVGKLYPIDLLRGARLFALAALLTFFTGGAGAQLLDRTAITNCFKSWDIAWRLPYFPRFSGGRCTVEEAKANTESTTFSGLPTRRQTISFAYQTDWFPPAPGEQPDRKRYEALQRESARLAFSHFDKLFLARQFRRVEDPRESDDEPPQRIPEFAAYEKAVQGGTWRIELKNSFHGLEILLEQRGALRAEASLPAPTESFDITQHGVNAKLFALPGVKLIEETIRFEQVMVAQPADQGSEQRDNSVRVFAPVRVFQYQLDRITPALELEAAYRELLTKTGWTVAADSQLTRQPVYRYKLGKRDLDISIRAWQQYETWPPFAEVTIADPGSWPAVVPLLRATEQRGAWEIAPVFESNGSASAATQREIFVFAAITERPQSPASSILVTPVVSAERQGDATAVKTARAAARWTADELVKRGLDAKKVGVSEDLRAPSVKKFNVSVGAHVSMLYCGTRTEARPDRAEERCECKTDYGVVSTSPGACAK